METSALGIVLWGLAFFTLLGLVFGFALAVAAAKFQVPVNPLVERVRDRLPAANCGACGFAGCQAYAEAVVERGDVSPNLCLPGRAAVAGAVAELTGKLPGSVVDRVVVLRCHGTSAFAPDEARYSGIRTCTASSFVFGGPKACKNGCLGLGDCVDACPFGALAMTAKGIPEVDHAKCTGCGLCVTSCPKDLWSFVPRNHRVELSCVAIDKRSTVRAACMVGCTLCRRCVAKCPAGAITWDGQTIVLDHEMCVAYGPSCQEICVDVCPSVILHRIGQSPEPEKAAPATAEA
jgi:electron transport complex protein RnfB